MRSNLDLSQIKITGMGIVSSTAFGIPAFTKALLSGQTNFGYLKRTGRENLGFIGAELPNINIDSVSLKYNISFRNASWSNKIAAVAVSEAWQDAKLDSIKVDPIRIGLVVGGSNFQQRHQQKTRQRYRSRPEFLTPSYGLSVWDTDLVGLLSQCFQINGEGYSVGAASASGTVALIHAARQIMMEQVDVSIAIGALCDVSAWECQALINMGAMGSERFADAPDLACRPFDRNHDGFIYGEGCGVLILEKAEHAQKRGVTAHGNLSGWGLTLDGNRNPNPSIIGEKRAMNNALQMAKIEPEQINYVNTHGTGSPLGDTTEISALKSVGLSHCFLNATKSLTGHCLTASGIVEAIATLIQIEFNFCHATRNLINPIDPSLQWVKETSISVEIRHAISNSFAFGGINAAIIISK